MAKEPLLTKHDAASPVQVAVIGCGYWGKNLVRNFSALGALTAVCDSDPETLARVAEQYAIRTYASYPELLAQVDLQPPGLFCWGDWSVASAPTVAIVGTRGATTYGKAVATKFAEDRRRELTINVQPACREHETGLEGMATGDI